MKAKRRQIVAGIVALLGSLVLGGMMIGFILGEGPRPDGSIGQPAWYRSAAFGTMGASGTCFLLGILNFADPRPLWIRLAAILPALAGVGWLAAAYARLNDENRSEIPLLLFLAGASLWLAVWLVREPA